MNEPILSIIVPVYNVEEYLIDCLESVAKSIEKIDAEVLLIDDGSKDNSGSMAKAFADAHKKFFYYRKENGGLSDARNFGTARAQGKYLCFVDSDDLVKENMYENMLTAAEYHQADLTIVNVIRFDSTGFRESSLHDRVFYDMDHAVAHIDYCDNFIYDTTAWNKLIRRDFWERNGFKYPVGWRFEDMPVSLAMHIKANKVAIVREIGYLWRDRDGKTRSITQENNSMINLTHRIKMWEDMYEYIEKEQKDPERLKTLLSFKILTEDLPMYVNMVAEYYVEEDPEGYSDTILSFMDRHFTETDYEKIPAAHKLKYRLLREGRKEELKTLTAFEKRKYKNLPFNKEGDKIYIDLPEEMFGISRASAENDIRLRNPESAITDIEIDGDRISIYSYCFLRRINTPSFEDMEISCLLFNSVTGNKKELELTRINNHALTKRVGSVYDGYNRKVNEYNYDGTGFSLTIDLGDAGISGQFPGNNCILVKYRTGRKEGIYTLKSPGPEWDSAIDGTDAVCENNTAHFWFDAGRTLWLNIGKNRPADEIQRSEDAVLCDVKKESSSTAIVNAQIPCVVGAACSAKFVCYDSLAQKTIDISDEAELTAGEQNANFQVDIDAAGIREDLYEGRRKLELQVTTAAGVQRYIPSASGAVCVSIVNDDRRAVFTADENGRLVMDVFRLNEPTGNSKLYAREMLYPQYMKEPLDEKCIVFEAYWGAQYSCNPRALYEYIDQEHPEYKCVWSLTDEKTPIKGKGIRVQRYSAEYYHYLATAKYFVNNVNFENAYKKRQGQIEIQTMHGTPFKSMGLDVKDDFPDEKAVRNYIKRNRRWNYLVVQGKFSESMAWQWFRYKGNILRTGYPRTDDLFNVSEEEKISLKDLYGIPSDKKVILYAPTFRHKGKYEMPLDLDLMRQSLSDEYVLLIRLHHFVSESYKVPEDGSFIFDAGKYSSINDFYKIADVLITDYSSVMFDYVLTGNKIIFFAYDLEEYTGSIRGTCFDLEKEAPGPVVRTTEDVISSIRSNEGFDEKRQAFLDKYLNYENSESSKKIFEEVFVKGRVDKKIKTRSVLIKAVKKLLPKKALRYLRNKVMKL